MLIIQIIAVLTFKAPLRRRCYVEGNVTIIFLQLRNITFNHLRIYERHTGVLKLQQNPYKNSKSVQMSRKFGQSVMACSAFFTVETEGWLAQQVGSESQRTFHLFETKKTLTPGQQ